MYRDRDKIVDRIDSDDELLDTQLPISASDSEEQYTPIMEEMIYSGLVLKNNYILLKKIGFGNNAAVWMIYNISLQSYMAMKIQDDQCYEDGCREVAIIKEINNYADKHPQEKIYCIKMLDYFVYEISEDIKYVCSLYELYAGSINVIITHGKYKYGLPIKVAKRIIKQLLISLNVLHNKLNIIHTDIKPENILFKGISEHNQKIIELFTKSMFQEKYDKLKKMFKEEDNKFQEELEALAIESVKDLYNFNINIDNEEEFIPDDDDDDDEIIEGDDDDDFDNDSSENSIENIPPFNKRRQSIEDLIEHLDYITVHDFDEECDYDFYNVLNNKEKSTDTESIVNDKYVNECEIALTDFGNSYFYNKRTRNEIQDRKYRAPEIILDFNYGYACDIWSVGCVAFELVTGFSLFEPETRPLTKDIHHLYLMEKMLGPLPLGMKKQSKRCRFLFDAKNNYHIKNIKPFTHVSIKDRLIKQFLLSDKDAIELCEFLEQCLIYNPNKRATVNDLLHSKWLN